MIDILKSHFLNLYAMALSDSQIDTLELETLYKIAHEKGIGKAEIDEVILNPHKVQFSFPESLNDKIVHLYDLARIILADGIVDREEKHTLELFCTRFGFEENNIPAIVDFLLDSAKKEIDVKELLSIINQAQD